MPARRADRPALLPAAVWLLVVAVVAVEAAMQLAALGVIGGADAAAWRLTALQRLGVSPAVLQWMLDNMQFPPEHLLRFVAYPFIHAGPLQALFVAALLAGLGRVLGASLPGRAILSVFVVGALAGGAVFAWIAPGAELLHGGIAAVFGLLGGFAAVLVLGPVPVGLMRTRALVLIAAVTVVRVALGLVAEPGMTWIADLAAFTAGAATAAVMRPGGWRALRARVRHD